MQAHRLTLKAFGLELAELLDSLLAPGLQEVCLDCTEERAPVLKWSPTWCDDSTLWCVGDERAVCKLLMTRGSEFAFEASAGRLAWRRWPPAGTPAWVAANERHEAALQWSGGPCASLEQALEDLDQRGGLTSVYD